MPDEWRATEALDIITQCFQAIAEEEARQKGGTAKEREKEAEKSKSHRSMFSFGSQDKDQSGETSRRGFIYDDGDEEEEGEREEQEQEGKVGEGVDATGDSYHRDGIIQNSKATGNMSEFESSFQSGVNLYTPDAETNVKEENTKEVNEEEEEEEESAARLAEWDQHRDAMSGTDAATSAGSAPSMLRAASRTDSVRPVHLADDFKYW